MRPNRSFTQADVRRAVLAVQKSGLDVASVTVDSEGRITITTQNKSPASPEDALSLWRSKQTGQKQEFGR